MPEKNQELELYKLVTKNSFECGWIDEEQFNVWVYWFEFAEFMNKIKNLYGSQVFDDGGIEAHVMEDYVCFDLTTILCGEDIDFEKVFPREEFKH